MRYPVHNFIYIVLHACANPSGTCDFAGFSLLLWIGAALCFLALLVQYLLEHPLDKGNIILGVVLILVVLVTSFFMYYQENKSSKVSIYFHKFYIRSQEYSCKFRHHIKQYL